MTNKLRELIPSNLILQGRYAAMSEFEKGFLLGAMSMLDKANRDLVRYYPRLNEIFLHTTCTLDFLERVSVVLAFFEGAFPQEWENPDHRPIGDS
jgi:hypothetical protein